MEKDQKQPAQKFYPDVVGELENLIRQFGSAEELLAAIRMIPGFAKTNRSTLYRWQRGLVDQAKPKLVIRLLKEQEHSVRLRLAVPETLQLLPVFIVLWNDVPTPKGEPYGLLKRLGVQTQVKFTPGGLEALNCLRTENYDVAFAAEELGQKHESSDIFGLCQLSESFWSGVTVKEGKTKEGIKTVDELEGLTIGYNPQTALVEKLPAIAKTFGVKFNWVPVRQTEEAINRLAEKKGANKIDVVLGWQPLLSQIEDHFRKHGHAIYPIDLGPYIHDAFSVKVWIYVKASANATAVRLLLTSLCPAIELVSTAQGAVIRGDETKLQALCRVCFKELGKKWESDMPSLRRALDPKAAIYELGRLKPEAILDLWQKEIMGSKKHQMLSKNKT